MKKLYIPSDQSHIQLINNNTSLFKQGDEIEVKNNFETCVFVMGFKHYRVDKNIGLVKYIVSFHDGITTHPDGSIFYDVRLFKNRTKLSDFEIELFNKGYKQIK